VLPDLSGNASNKREGQANQTLTGGERGKAGLGLLVWSRLDVSYHGSC
jgi:hypothetical protein